MLLRRKAIAPLPPGPRRKPLIGNLLDVPFNNPWAVFEAWRKKYGDVVYLNILGNKIVILNSLDAIVDLFERRAGSYSHRPVFTMVGELMGLDMAIGLNNRDKVWRQQRRLTALILGPAGIKQYIPLQERLATLLVAELQESPEDFAGLFNLMENSVIIYCPDTFKVANSVYPQIIKECEETFVLVSQSIQYGAYLLDFLPWLKHVPAWVPFSPHSFAASGKARILSTVRRPFQFVEDEMKKGTAKPSLVSHLLSNRSDVEGLDFENILAWAAGTMYGAGAESTSATLTSFLLAMAVHPDVQTRAQEELDQLLKNKRLPTMEDRAALPYLCAVIKESMRWHVALPLSLVRTADKDDVYNGHLIPKGAIILPNVRGIAGEGDYLTEFSPERHMREATGVGQDIDPYAYAFGFGRRACPGQYLAENSLFIFAASILTAFKITNAVDSEGKTIPIVPRFVPGLISNPEPFKCSIIPRTPATRKLIANELLASSTT
ncbi:cytochrome P450 [Mycena belliarum]|uniref:Cytochrome P450 n=1 Tax=Mycena belliarum TaxID=1033014 RepID=A0AAD6U6A6_9AGAR|nr:cytochrome P450 [Mycena belliae]